MRLQQRCGNCCRWLPDSPQLPHKRLDKASDKGECMARRISPRTTAFDKCDRWAP